MKNSEMPAYPLDGNHNGNPESVGLTKREYFAGLAMQAMIANPDIVRPQTFNADEEYIVFSMVAVSYADSLLKQLEDK